MKIFDGDLEAALTTFARAQSPYKYNWLSSYAVAKIFAVWWAVTLSGRLPAGQTVNAVSPGGAAATNFARYQPLLMRFAMRTATRTIGRLVGMDGPLSAAARRYLDATAFDDDTTGLFVASPPGKMVGSLEVQKESHFHDKAYQEACWNVVVRLAGGVGYPEQGGQ